MKQISYFLILLLTLQACESPKEKLARKIKQVEENDSMFSEKLMNELQQYYTEFANKYPDDDRSADYLFKAAQINITANRPNEAVLLLNNIIEKYPQHNICENAMFLLAFTYENSLNDLQQAEVAYKRFLEKYPESELRDDADLSLKNLGKKPEEIIKSQQPSMP